ncbi:MAG: DNA primase [Clostridiales bacterium]|jgi:DNA primase|nr:DNA primase [Clostridiales bacterium]
MLFPEQFLYELTSRCDIVQTVSRYVALSRRGTRHFGLCPFHNEKTPSFCVSADRQFYYCFGCGAGGDVISFIMGIENISFTDAVAKLAEQAGMRVPETGADFEAGKKRKRLIEVCRDAARFYHDMLKSGAGSPARAYLERRGIKAAAITAFGIGYSPPERDLLINTLADKGYNKTELLEAGLIVPDSSGGFYDRFRNRVMFPIIDARGAVIGFGGRVLDDSQPKYLNSPETLIFNKRKNLFALNIARKSKSDYFILAEGYLDVISLHQEGFGSAVASLGTAITGEQGRLVSRYKKKVVIAYDSDTAGINASERAIEIMKSSGVSVRVLRMTGAKDPDEYIKKFGREKFARLLDASKRDTEYRLDTLRAKHDLKDDAERLEYLKEAVEVLSRLDGAIERDIYIARVAETAGVSKDAVFAEVNGQRRAAAKKSLKEKEKRDLSPVRKLMPASRELKYSHPKSAFAEEGLAALLFAYRDLIPKAAEKLKPEHFSSELLARLYALISEQYREGSELTMSGIALKFDPEETAHIAAVLARHGSPPKDALDDYIDTIEREFIIRNAESGDGDLLIKAAEFYRKKKGYGDK